MALVLKKIYLGYRYTFEELPDPRTKDWFLVGKPGQFLLIAAAYYYGCTNLGRWYMKNREPYELKRTIQIYNILQVLSNLYLLKEALAVSMETNFSFMCQPVVPGEEGLRLAAGFHLYLMNKYLDWFDTIFFVLRKKFNHVSSLHLHHHLLMVVASWIGTTFLPGGNSLLIGLINSFIHIIMYSYYFVSALGPEYQKYLWWKKHLTLLQMAQFCIIFVQNFQASIRRCGYPLVLNIILTLGSLYFLWLFSRFYISSYMKKTDHNMITNDVRQNGVNKSEKNNLNGHILQSDKTESEYCKNEKTKFQ